METIENNKKWIKKKEHYEQEKNQNKKINDIGMRKQQTNRKWISGMAITSINKTNIFMI